MNKTKIQKIAVLGMIIVDLNAALFSTSVWPEETPTTPAQKKPGSPWGFNLSTYVWLPGVNGDFTAGPYNGSVDHDFIDIVDESRSLPLGFNGHFEAHYDRFAFYMDGNYMNIKLKPKLDRISEGVDSEMGIMDYGLMYRILGATASEIRDYQGKKHPLMLDAYAGARTLWLGNSVAISGPFGSIGRSSTISASFTSPVIGGRIGYDFTPNWFVLVDGNIGGFGAQSVDLTDSIVGMLGYRTSFFGVPASIEAGYRALHYDVSKNAIATNLTLNGPFIGLTGYW